jgi:hypothetical protein
MHSKKCSAYCEAESFIPDIIFIGERVLLLEGKVRKDKNRVPSTSYTMQFCRKGPSWEIARGAR